MAINIKNYVDISTTFPVANFAGRSFGGLVFTAKNAIEQTSEDKDMVEAYEAYMDGGVTFLTIDEVGLLFGVSSDEYKFAVGYYGYISPSGRFASRLAYAKISDGETPLQAFSRVNKFTNLFGSFTFLSVPGGGDSTSSGTGDLEALKEVAAYNSSLGVKYLFVVNRPVGDRTVDDIIEECELFKANRGTVYVAGKTDVSGYMPMAILGSTDYSNGQVVNFMFKQFATEEPTVEDDKTYVDFGSAYVNFYGRTQTNGQTIDFYQRGFNTNGTDTAIYCNEMWFKSVCETALMGMLVSRERLSADALGVDLVKLEVLDCCSGAVRNTMFSQKELSAADIRSVREIVYPTGGSETEVESIEADISTKGYSVYAYLSSRESVSDLASTGEKAIIYYVFYGTADSIRYIKGNNILL